MTFKFDLSNRPRDTWDSEILAYEVPEVCQTSLYGELILKSGKTPGFISIYQNGDLIGNCLVESSNEKIATWLYGPLIKSEKVNKQEEIIKELLLFLKKIGMTAVENAKTQKYFDPKITFNEKSDIYSRIGGSPFIDVRPDMNEIMNSFDRSVRKNVNKCERNGVEIIISEEITLIEPYLEMLSWFRSSRNFGMPAFFPNTYTMKMFNSRITSMGIALAKFDGDFLAGMGFVTIGSIMTELAMASSYKYEAAKLPVNDYLKVKAIEFYKQKGITLYDLAGGEKNPSDPKKLSITQFKQKFATGTASYGMIDRKILSYTWYTTAVKRKIKYIFSK
jgi:lipid II:glycine glycyltransferase (peptidoglycan interpeptide bridge formation enzyme)